MSDGNDLLSSSGKGTPWAKFPVKGTTVVGKILEAPVARQSRNFEDGTPAEWPDGSPKMEVAVRVATAERDPDIEDDDGTRQFVLPVNTEIFRAVQAAMKAAQVKALEPGGTLKVKFKSERKHEKRGYNPIKEYVAEYAPPAPASEADAMDALAGLVAGDAPPF